MYCRNCRKELTGTPQSCDNCGARPTAGSAYCPSCGAKTSPTTEVCAKCGAGVAGQSSNTLPVLTHILGLVTGWLGPLIVLLATSEEPVKNHARMALNWQLSLVIYSIVSGVLVFVVAGIFLLIAIYILDLIFCIMAAVKAGRGELWQYPLTIPFLKVKPDTGAMIVR